MRGACYYVLLAPFGTLALALALFLPIPLEGLGLILDFGFRAGYSRFKQRQEVVAAMVPGWVERFRTWAKKVSQDTILMLAVCVCIAVVAMLATPVVLFLIAIYGAVTMIWWLSLALLLPGFYSIMVIGR